MSSKFTVKIKNILLYLSLISQFQNFSLALTLEKSRSFLDSTAEEILSQMSLDEKIGQLFIVGFPQNSLDQKLKKHIRKNKIGSFILFKRNITNLVSLKNLNSELVQYSVETQKVPPLLAIDQEGGNVARIETTPKMPYFFQLGNIEDSNLIYQFGKYTAELLSSLGFNLNLAPVLDLADSTESSFISLRSFGNNPAKVSTLGFSYSKGLLDNGVIPTAKHFPGLGNSKNDPHTSFTSRSSSLKELETFDLKPFKEFSKLGSNSAVMLSHMVYNNLDHSQKPASFSQFIIKDLLRRRLGFSGVVITDDLQMKASSLASFGPSQGALDALLAGADIVMLSWSLSDQTSGFNFVKSAILSEKMPMSLVNEKVLRILTLKKNIYQKSKLFFKNMATEPIQKLAISSSPPEAEGIVSFSKNSVVLNQLQKNIFTTKVNTVLLNLELLLNSKNTKNNFCVVSSFNKSFDKLNFPNFNQFLGFKLPLHTRTEDFVSIFKKSPCEVFFLIIDNFEQVRVLNSFSPSKDKRIVVFNYTHPSALKNRDKFFNVIDFYGLASADIESLSSRLQEFSILVSRKFKQNSFYKE